MLKLLTIYWKFRYTLANIYFTLKYKHKPPAIYYDKLTHIYIHPRLLEERSTDLSYVLCELIKDNPTYTYLIDNKKYHTHSFTALLLEAYNNKQSFKLLDPTELSQQELRLINEAKL